MKVLITGGGGFLGKKLALALQQEGHNIRLLLRTPDENPGFPDMETMQGDLFDPPSLARACVGQEAVFHTAGVISYNPAKADLMLRTNVLGTKAIAEAAQAAGVKRFVHTSSTAAIGVSTDPDRKSVV